MDKSQSRHSSYEKLIFIKIKLLLPDSSVKQESFGIIRMSPLSAFTIECPKLLNLTKISLGHAGSQAGF
jgi:hypothetical protein